MDGNTTRTECYHTGSGTRKASQCQRSSNKGSCNETVIQQYDIGSFINSSSALDDYTKRQLLENPWMPPRTYDFPFSEHKKKGRNEKRYVGHSHFEQYPWLVYSHVMKGLFCRYCPFFVPGQLGGKEKATPLQNLVTKPLKSFAKLLGKAGHLETHNCNKYHRDAVEKRHVLFAILQKPEETCHKSGQHSKTKASE